MSAAAVAVAPPKSDLYRIRPVVIDDIIRIPPEVIGLASFRRWAESDYFPEGGRFSYFQGEIWVDLSPEQLYTHNQVKLAYSFGLGGVLRDDPLGRYFPDGARLSIPLIDFSTVPDGVFCLFDSLESGRVRRIEGATTGYIELEGTPDMTLEVISDTSVHKDTEVLFELYWRAGVREYWLVDARGKKLDFDIFRHTKSGYKRTRSKSGWLKSNIFGRSFRLHRETDRLGDPQYVLQVRG